MIFGMADMAQKNESRHIKRHSRHNSQYRDLLTGAKRVSRHKKRSVQDSPRWHLIKPVTLAKAGVHALFTEQR